jgi:hypothetical protein
MAFPHSTNGSNSFCDAPFQKDTLEYFREEEQRFEGAWYNNIVEFSGSDQSNPSAPVESIPAMQ